MTTETKDELPSQAQAEAPQTVARKNPGGRHKGCTKSGGRKPGALNKITVKAKEAFALAFEGIGGVPALVKWARDPENRGDFYKLYARLIPQEFHGSVSVAPEDRAVQATRQWLDEVAREVAVDTPAEPRTH